MSPVSEDPSSPPCIPPSAPTEIGFLPATQPSVSLISSSTLFHFTRSVDNLVGILANGFLVSLSFPANRLLNCAVQDAMDVADSSRCQSSSLHRCIYSLNNRAVVTSILTRDSPTKTEQNGAKSAVLFVICETGSTASNLQYDRVLRPFC